MESFRRFFRQLNIKKFRKHKSSDKHGCNITNKYDRRNSFTGAKAGPLETVLEEEECIPSELTENDDTNSFTLSPNSFKNAEEFQINGEQLDVNASTPTVLSVITEVDFNQWKPQDEAFLKEQRLILDEEFENDSGFKSAEDIGVIGRFKPSEVDYNRSPTFNEQLSKPFQFPDIPPMTSSARSSMDSSTAKHYNRVRLSLGMGNCTATDQEKDMLFQSDGITNDNELQISPEMISMARRTSIDGYEELTEISNIYEEIVSTDISDVINARRKEILVILADCNIITIEDAYIILNNPRRYKLNTKLSNHNTNNNIPKKPEIEHFLWLPDEFDSCLVDYINFKCIDTTSFKNLLTNPVPVAVNDAEAFAKVMSPEAKVQDLIVDGSTVGMFYSFCLNRAVFGGSTQHCSKCRTCVDWRYWHCDTCDKCSYGLSYGKCEHCSFSPKHISSYSDYSTKIYHSNSTSNLVGSYSEFKQLVDPSIESSINNLSELGDSKSHGDCYCGNPSCENLYCTIIQDNCLNCPYVEDCIQDVYQSRDTSFVIGNRSSRSRTSESSGKSLSLFMSENVQYHSTPTLEMSFICRYTSQSIRHLSMDSFMLSRSI